MCGHKCCHIFQLDYPQVSSQSKLGCHTAGITQTGIKTGIYQSSAKRAENLPALSCIQYALALLHMLEMLVEVNGKGIILRA